MIWLVLIVVLPCLYIFYNKWSWIHSYWEFKGFQGPWPLPFVGNVLQVITSTRSLGELCLQWSREFNKSPLVGIYNFMTPYIMVNRNDYVGNVMVEDFCRFTGRMKSQSKCTGQQGFLTASEGAEWKAIRTKISPIFTEEKIKGMFNCVKMCSENTVNRLEAKLKRDVASIDIIKPYTVDVAKRLVFGLESDDSADFQKTYETMADYSTSCCNLLLCPAKIVDIPRTSRVQQKHTDYFKKILQEGFRKRKQDGTRRNDILQLLLELKENGNISVDKWNDTEDKFLMPDDSSIPSETLEITDELLTKQALDFLTTGVEMTTSALTFTLLELCINQTVMDNLVHEVDKVLEERKVLTYEALQEMKYLEMCIKEAMRLHPVTPVLTRLTTRNYTFDNGQQSERDTMICVPVLAIHSDPKQYPEPSSFKPERFATSPPPYTYLAFGEGPRMCIAKTLVMMEMKLLLAELISKYDIKLGSRTKLPVLTDNRNPLLTPRNPVYFHFKSR